MLNHAAYHFNYYVSEPLCLSAFTLQDVHVLQHAHCTTAKLVLHLQGELFRIFILCCTYRPAWTFVRKSCSTVHMHKNRFNFTSENTVDSRSLDICDDMSGNVVVLVKMLLPTNFKSLVLSFPWLSSLIGSGFCLVFHYVLQTRKFLERCHLIWSTHHMTTPGQTSSFS